MITKIKNSWELAKESFQVLSKDKELMMFPVISSLVLIVVMASFFVSAGYLYNSLEQTGAQGAGLEVIGAVVLFLFYFISYFIIVFFNVGIIQCARIRFEGGDPTFMDGIKAGISNLGLIIQWAALSGIIGVLLAQLERFLGEALGGFVRKLLGGAWSIVTFFAVPVLIFEKTNAWESLKKSGTIIKKTWGESLTAYLGFGALQGALVGGTFLLAIAALAVSIVTSNFIILAVVGGLVVLSWILMAIIFSTLTQIYRTALYIYATTGEAPKVFSEDRIKFAFTEK
ncbi:MAG: DUF6159 family protein [Vulcanimicrobiota bacterium]